ncbi:MAG TPA: aminodeoxychorismate synthase component I [Aromatoleum sp.]|uniref:aminodeoxychorismate synthase component I n=1 Tax=Aromatoleum sp. TaxID=2307007 RepID=UPI002B49DDDB|nr:aminodeoxychorismate synthase component I [Aromatoleum sp.]HJV25824.1 aminodeoxychorismate synthase component I [Aromatoleum sp.]
MACFALLDDCNSSAIHPTSRLYTGFVREHRCDDPATLDAVWRAVERDQRAGGHAVVLADYEWGARLQRIDTRPGGQGGALRVLIFAELSLLSAAEVEDWLLAQDADGRAGYPYDVAHDGPATILAPRMSVDRKAFDDAIARIHHAIGEGETYQVNYTYRLDFDVFGSPVSLYRRLRERQPVAYGAFIALPPGPGASHILSCSPELFLRHEGGRLVTRPMKGTSRRASVVEVDSELARQLEEDVKNRAENLMIVDLLRNDLGRIAKVGSVRVPALFSIEPYTTVFQMTSTVEAELPDEVGFPAILRALFPCGSITGAPKHRTMQLIGELENTPRGLYTGSIGWIDAPGPDRSDAACGDFCLSVAIRTLTLGAAHGHLRRGQMGVGAGIVIDSTAPEEFAECALKARFLTGLVVDHVDRAEAPIPAKVPRAAKRRHHAADEAPRRAVRTA